MPRVTPGGRVTIPESVREALGIAPGDEIRFEETAEGFVIRKERSITADGTDPFEKYRGSAEGDASMSERMRRLRGEHQPPADDTNEDVDPEAETRTR